MLVAIAGAHGKIAMRLARLLADGGHDVIGLIRNPDHAADVSREGASPVICDLEQARVELPLGDHLQAAAVEQRRGRAGGAAQERQEATGEQRDCKR